MQVMGIQSSRYVTHTSGSGVTAIVNSVIGSGYCFEDLANGLVKDIRDHFELLAKKASNKTKKIS